MTAEFAVALPAFVLVVVAAIFGVVVVLAQLRCVDAAAVAARMAARGEPAGQIHATALAGAPGSASLELTGSAEVVSATVTATVAPLPVLRFLPGISVRGRVVQAREPSPAPAP